MIDIIISIDKLSKIEAINVETGYKAIFTNLDNKIKVNRNYIYFIPITDKTLDMTDHNVIKPNNNYSEFFMILTIRQGYAIIKPILDGFEIIDNMKIGEIL